MEFLLEVTDTDGEFFWYAENLKDISNILQLHYGTENEEKKIEKIEIFPLTDKE